MNDKKFNRKEVIYLLLASIAYEEFALANIMNAEAGKIEKAIKMHPCLDDLLAVNESVNKTLQNVIKKEMLLQFKMEEVMDFECPKHCEEE